MDRREQVAIAAGVLLVLVVPIAVDGWPTTLVDNAYVALLVVSGLCLMWWRTHPRLASSAGLLLFLAAASMASFDAYFPILGSFVFAALSAVLGTAYTGRARWLVAATGLVFCAVFWFAVPIEVVPLLLMTVPAFVAGVVLRLRSETADELAERSRELEQERELFASLARQHERARIASELHDIVGHAISVMVVQAAAGQRLVGTDPGRTDEVFEAIAESARHGKEDLRRLVELLGGCAEATDEGEGSEGVATDLSVIDEVVAQAARTGLDVSCRFDGDRDGVPGPVAHIAYRVVQEGLTNALRHAPGGSVRVRVTGEGRGLTVRVENTAATREDPVVPPGGRGLLGLRERIQDRGGQLRAGPTPAGGWLVEAHLPPVRPGHELATGSTR